MCEKDINTINQQSLMESLLQPQLLLNSVEGFPHPSPDDLIMGRVDFLPQKWRAVSDEYISSCLLSLCPMQEHS